MASAAENSQRQRIAKKKVDLNHGLFFAALSGIQKNNRNPTNRINLDSQNADSRKKDVNETQVIAHAIHSSCPSDSEKKSDNFRNSNNKSYSQNNSRNHEENSSQRNPNTYRNYNNSDKPNRSFSQHNSGSNHYPNSQSRNKDSDYEGRTQNFRKNYSERKHSYREEKSDFLFKEESRGNFESYSYRNCNSSDKPNRNFSQHNSDSNHHSNFKSKNKDSVYEGRTQNFKKNYSERKHSYSEEKSDVLFQEEEEESGENIEFDGENYHERAIIKNSNEAIKISFNAETFKSASSFLAPCPSLSPESPTSNLSYDQSVSGVSHIPTISPATGVSDEAALSLVSNLHPASPVSSLSSQTPDLFHASQVPSSPLPVSTFPPTSAVSKDCLHLPPSILPYTSHNSDLVISNSAHTHLLSSDKEFFIPPPVIPATLNKSVLPNATSEGKEMSSAHNDLHSEEACTDEEIYSYDLDPEHIAAISKFVLLEVKNRAFPLSSNKVYDVVRDLNALFKNHLRGNVIEVYGSCESDLAISTSDINLVVIADVSIRKSFMFEMYKVLCSERAEYHILPFQEESSTHRTKINFSHPDTGVSCQLAYLGKNKKNVFNMGRYLKEMSLMDHRVRNLIIATKLWAEDISINEVVNGRLHPVGYALLVIHFLQHTENPILPILDLSNEDNYVKAHKKFNDDNNASIGELWMAFLKYFSVTFNWKQDVVTVTSLESVSKKSKHWENYWMAIEDPFSGKNIAESIVNCDTAVFIQACFKSSYSYFCNPSEATSLCSSNGEDQNAGNVETPSIQYEFSFRQCLADQSDFCEACDEIDDICDDCKKKIYVQPMASVPKMTDNFLNLVKTALMTTYDKYILSEKEIIERKQFVKELERKVSAVYPDAKLNLFGSSTNGFGFKHSDLDICVTFKTKKMNSASVLKDIRYILRKDRNFDHVVAIFNAKIPIIKFHYQPTGWRGDISLDNTLAVHNSELLYTYSLIDERSKVLGCALKLLSKKAMVSEVTDRALSSYSYLIMVIHFLQQVEPPILPLLQDNKYRNNNFKLDHIVEDCNVWFCKDLDYIKQEFKCENETPVEQLWLDLLDYYCSFKDNQCITIRQKEAYFMNEKMRCARLFNIQDPFIETKNLGCVVSQKKAQETISVLNRARQNFRSPVKQLPSGVKDIEDYFFSTMSLTGRIHKEAHCELCGKFGHERKECKQVYFPIRRPNFGLKRYNGYKNTFKNKQLGKGSQYRTVYKST